MTDYLTDRPCAVCKYHTGKGCTAWECVFEKEPILDKIRAEIDSYCSDNRDRNDGLYIAMRIIDKYRQEG